MNSELKNPLIGTIIVLGTATVPVAILPGWSLYFDSAPKAALLCVAACGLLLAFRRLETGFQTLARSRAGALFIGYTAADVLWLALSSAFSQSPVLSIMGTGWRRLGALEYWAIDIFCLLGAAYLAGNGRALTGLLRAFCCAGALSGGYGIFQYFGWDPWIDQRTYQVAFANLFIVRPPGTTGQATYFAGYLIVVVFLAVALWLAERSRPWRLVAVATAVIAALALILTGTRAGLLGVAAGGLYLLLNARPRFTARRAAAAGALAAALVGLYFTPPAGRLRDRIAQWSGDRKGGTRLLLWHDCLSMARDRPLLGTGPETFAREFPRYESVTLARAYPEFYHESPHNICVDALVSQGIPGVALLLVGAALGLARPLGRRAAHPAAGPIAAGLAGLFVSQQFSAFVLTTAFLFHWSIAMLVAIRAAAGESPASGSDNARRVFKPFRILAAPAGVIFLLAGLQIFYVDSCWREIRRNLDSNQVEKAMGLYERTDAILPPESGPYIWYSRALFAWMKEAPGSAIRTQALAQAYKAARRAVDTSEDHASALFNLAVFYSMEGDTQLAEQTAMDAVQSAPRWFQPHWLLAEFYLASGRLDRAEREARAAISLDGRETAETRKTLERIESARRAALQSPQ